MKRSLVLSFLILLSMLFSFLIPSFSAEEINIQPVTNLPVLKINDIQTIQNTKSELVIATEDGIYSTSDRGESWIQLNRGLPNGEVLQLHYQEEPFLFLASVKNAGIWKWQPAGKNWVSFNTNLPAKQVNCFFKTEKYIYAGSNKEGLFRVKVGAEKWQDLNFDDKNPFLSSLHIRDIYFTDEKRGWLATDTGLVSTDNEGELWTRLQSNALNNVSLFTFFASAEKNLFLTGTEDKGIYASQDTGKTWKEWQMEGLPPLPYSARSIVLESSANRYWISTEKGLWISNPETNSFTSHSVLSGKSLLIAVQAELDGWNSLWIGSEKDGLYYSYTVKPPSKPTDLTYTIGKKTVELSWKESKTGSHPVAGYTIYRKLSNESLFQPVGTSKTSSWTDQDVEWLDTFDYAVQAFDTNVPPVRSVQSDPISVLVDDTPFLDIRQPPPDFETTNEEVVVEGVATDDGSGIQQVSLSHILPSQSEKSYQLSLRSDGSFQQLLPLGIGDNTVTIQAVDNRSHQTSETRHIYRREAAKDTAPPLITITKPADRFTHEAGSILVSGKIVDAEGHLLESRIWVEQNANRLYYRVLNLDPTGTFSETISIPFGEISIHVQAIDTFGNQSEMKVVGTNTEPDLTPPQFYILSPLHDAETEEEQIRFYGRAWDEESGIQSIRVSLDYLSKRMYDRDITLNDQGFFDLLLPIMEGENHLILQVLDKKNNESKETRIVFRKAKPKNILIELMIGKNTALVNGETLPLLYPPEIKKGRTYVPVRFVSEALGANVLWVGQRKEIQITWKEKFISLWLNKTIVTVESLVNPDQVPKTLFLETAPYLAKGVTMVPLRLIAEQFGITPQWNPDTQTITLVLIP